MGHRAVDIAGEPCQPCTMDGDPGRQVTEGLVVDDDHPVSGPFARCGHPVLGVLQGCLDALDFAPHQA